MLDTALATTSVTDLVLAITIGTWSGLWTRDGLQKIGDSTSRHTCRGEGCRYLVLAIKSIHKHQVIQGTISMGCFHSVHCILDLQREPWSAQTQVRLVCP